VPFKEAVIYSAQLHPAIMAKPLTVLPFLTLHVQGTSPTLEASVGVLDTEWVVLQWHCTNEITAPSRPSSRAVISHQLLAENLTKGEDSNLGACLYSMYELVMATWPHTDKTCGTSCSRRTGHWTSCAILLST
jgi:hypothetical protein